MSNMQPQNICCTALQRSLGKEANLKIKAHSSYKNLKATLQVLQEVRFFQQAPPSDITSRIQSRYPQSYRC